MGWQLAVGLNELIALCYFVISSLILLGLLRTRQLSRNPLALATAAIFFTCGVHHAHHGVHLLMTFGHHSSADLALVRHVFGSWHSVAVDVLGAVVAISYLGLRRQYKALLNTPQMFEDRVRVAAEARLRDLAFTDQLTGIPNRAAFQALADRYSAEDDSAVLLFLDLDGFKGINDRHGHDVGDRVLRDVAQGLTRVLRDDEHVFRLGGDEMIVVALAHSPLAVAEFQERIEAAVGREVETRDGAIVVAASCGLAQGTARNINSLLRLADQDMYRVKRRGEPAGVPVPRDSVLAVPVPPSFPSAT